MNYLYEDTKTGVFFVEHPDGSIVIALVVKPKEETIIPIPGSVITETIAPQVPQIPVVRRGSVRETSGETIQTVSSGRAILRDIFSESFSIVRFQNLVICLAILCMIAMIIIIGTN